MLLGGYVGVVPEFRAKAGFVTIAPGLWYTEHGAASVSLSKVYVSFSLFPFLVLKYIYKLQAGVLSDNYLH